MSPRPRCRASLTPPLAAALGIGIALGPVWVAPARADGMCPVPAGLTGRLTPPPGALAAGAADGTGAGVQARGPAQLGADRLTISGRNRLVASGHVTVEYAGYRLAATRVEYDRTAGRLKVAGPITLVDEAGRITILADSAQLSADLRDGIMQSARMVLDDRVQLAAAQIDRVGGRYTQLKNTVASSCTVSTANPTPLWEIRARRVVHDQVRRRIYFEDAQLRVAGIPVFYLPRLALPDPSVKRATGFLVPKFSGSSTFGTGIKIPYFVTLGPSRDLTFTPFIATRNAASLGLRYRQAFNTGRLRVEGQVSRDAIRPGKTRGYLFATGDFTLPRDYKLHLQLQKVSDPDYFLNYGLPQVDRLKSGLTLSQTRRDRYIEGQVLNFHSIRAGESNATLPTDVADFTEIRRFTPPVLGGQASLRFDGHGQIRPSNQPVAGRDVARLGVGLDWRRSWIAGPGLVIGAMGSLRSDIYAVGQDPNYPSTVVRTVPTLGVELRWPLVRRERAGATQVLEPIVQLAWSPRHVARVPNEDSLLTEFDEGNLWSLRRFSGNDGVERGARANVGLSWTRYDPAGWTLGVVAGRIFRTDPNQQFDRASGLGGTRSDWLVAVQARWRSLDLINRAVFGNGKGLAKNELRLQYKGKKAELGSSFIWMVADPNAYLPLTTLPTREWVVDAGYDLPGNWRGQLGWRYDFVAKRAESTALKLAWHNECVSVDLSLSRSYASSTSVAATTTFGFSVGLIGFGGGSGNGPDPGSCRR